MKQLNIKGSKTPTVLVSSLKNELEKVGVNHQQINAIINELTDISYALDQSSIVAITDHRGTILSVNDTFCKISQYTREELIGQNHRILKSNHHNKEFFAHMWKTITSGKVWKGEVKNRAKDGSYYWVKTAIFPFLDSNGKPYKFISVRTDITEGKLYEDRVRQLLKNDFSQVMKSLDNFVFKLKKSEDNQIVFTLIAGKLAEELGLWSDQHLHIPIGNIVPKYVIQKLAGSIKKTFSGETSRVEVQYGKKYLFITLSPFYRDNEVEEIVGSVSDITDLKNSEQIVQHMAYHDFLTDLPNRRMLDKDLAQRINDEKESNQNIGVLFIDLDHFKRINDTLGHSVGDYVLIMAAHRLQKIDLSPYLSKYSLYHLGGDEFVFLISNFQEEQVKKACEYLLSVFESPFLYKQNDIHLKISIGASFYPANGDTPEDMIKNADIALFAAKEFGRNTYLFYTDEMNTNLVEKLETENDLRKAIASGDQLVLYFQPQLELATNKIVGLEALVRWNHPEKGLVPPLKFIQVAEDTGLIIPLGEWVLKEACQQLKKWQTLGYENITVSVNIATKHFQHPTFIRDVKNTLELTGIQSKNLELEITENSLLDDTEATIETLTKIQELGIQIAIDDFGTGYSSLSYLKKFPISTLKIDQSFVAELPENKGDRAIVSSIISLAHNLGLRVIAEGVENMEALQYLKFKDCDQIQGYYFSRPKPVDELTLFLEKHTGDSLKIILDN